VVYSLILPGTGFGFYSFIVSIFKWFTKVNLGGSLMWDPPAGLDEFLSSSELCDCENPRLAETVRKVADGSDSPREAALKIFLYVRDRVLFGLDNFDFKASETLSRGYGQCVNKANLQVALLRSIDIPARYHRVVLSRDCLKGIVPNITFNSIPERIWWHPYCEVYLEGEWISCETLFDKRLYEGALEEGIFSLDQIPSIDWDGESDLIQVSHWILEDGGTHPDQDEVFKQAQKEALPPKFIANFFLRHSYRYTNKLREKAFSP
jgi:hypothetical protein